MKMLRSTSTNSEDKDEFPYRLLAMLPLSPLSDSPLYSFLPSPLPLEKFSVQCSKPACSYINYCTCSKSPRPSPTVMPSRATLRPKNYPFYELSEEECASVHSDLSIKCEINSQRESSEEPSTNSSLPAEDTEENQEKKQAETDVAEGKLLKRFCDESAFTKEQYRAEALESYRAKKKCGFFDINNSLKSRYPTRVAAAKKRKRSKASGKYLPKEAVPEPNRKRR